MSVAYDKLDFESNHGNNEVSHAPNSSNTPINILLRSDVVNNITKGFKSLNTCPREIYTNFFLKFCESYGYFALSQVLVIFLHDEFGTSDVEAGFVYGIWGICITFWGLVTSFFNDSLGVRRSLLIGFSISFCSSIIIAFTTSKHFLYFMLFCVLPIGTGMGIPMLTVGIKRYTTALNRGFAFGLYYAVMNIAAFVSGPIIDFFNIYLNDTPLFGRKMSGNRMVILTTTCTYAMSLIATTYFLREIKVYESEGESSNLTVDQHSVNDSDDVELTTIGSSSNSSSSGVDAVYSPVFTDSPRLPRTIIKNQSNQEDENDEEQTVVFNTLQPNNLSDVTDDSSSSYVGSHSNNSNELRRKTDGVSTSSVQSYEPKSESMWATIKLLIYSKTFWRFVVLTLFLINLKTIFRHLDATLPTYLIRNFGPKYPKGMIYSINPFMIIWLTPLVAAMTTTYAHFDMIKYGGYISAISPFFMVFSTSTWAVVMFVVLLSLGEAIWSPRTYDYTMSIAPEGKEASFSALASAPLFAAKVPVGLLSGYLLQTYLPEDGSKSDGSTLWLIVGLLTISSPILITLFEPWIREPSTLVKR